MKHDAALYRKLQKAISDQARKTKDNLDWLYAQLHPFFFVTMKEEFDSIVCLAMNLQNVSSQRQITLADQEKKLLVARLNTPGSLYDTLKTLKEREISYAELTHSHDSIPGSDKSLEIHRYEFNRKSSNEIDSADIPKVPYGTKKAVSRVLRQMYPEFDFRWFDNDIGLLFLNIG